MGESGVENSSKKLCDKSTLDSASVETSDTSSSLAPASATQETLSNEFRCKIAYGSVKEVEKQLTTKEALNLLLKANISDIKYLTEDQLTVRNYS